jgi:hypothetical protein
VALEIEGSNPSVHPTLSDWRRAMNEETPQVNPEQPPSSETTAPQPADAGAAKPAGNARRGLPRWLPLVLLAVVPALVVGALVYALSGGGDSDEGAAGALEGILRPPSDPNTQIDSFRGEVPPKFPDDFPLYSEGKVVVSLEILSDQGTSYFVVMNTKDSTDDVYDYYRAELDDDPWQVEIGQSSAELTGVRFLRPDNPDVSGTVIIHRSDLDDTTSIYVSYEDVSAAISPGSASNPFDLSASRPLPPGFPNDVPIYSSRGNNSVVVDTYFERGGGGQIFRVSFLTKDSSDDVIKYYTDEFKGRGWTATDSTGQNATSFALSLNFADNNQSLQGQITADSFEDDADYTKVDMLVQVTGARSRGN